MACQSHRSTFGPTVATAPANVALSTRRQRVMGEKRVHTPAFRPSTRRNVARAYMASRRATTNKNRIQVAW